MSISDHHVARTSSLDSLKLFIAAVNPSFKARAALTASCQSRGEQPPGKIITNNNSRKYRVGDCQGALAASEGSLIVLEDYHIPPS
jgi:hypothetical protein